ncbi:MAG TPA: phosphate ABC transporter substrate-binding protein PstS [Candidatus Saccharimonadales bacterium]|nr:phosphate ABC transporter substrate-binding protein PstS [Candidatus Saccharimonadales bacterium]
MRTGLLGGIALLGTLAVAACGGSSNATTPTPASGTPAAAATGNPTSAVTLHESGSSLLYPFLEELVAPLTQAYSNITLAPAPGGSGKGISDAIAGATSFGGSDAYLSPGQASQNATLENIPIAVSAQAVNYNLPGITNLKLSGGVLAKIYKGTITKWNDSAIAALNPGVTLPATGIIPVRRLDGSGDTFIFTSLLSATDPSWSSGPGFGTTINWPAVSSEQSAMGNPAMVATCSKSQNVGCVAYIGVSAEASALSAGLGEAELQNQAGNFVTPTQTAIEAAVAAAAGSTPANLRQSLIYSNGAQAYPIVNFEYIIVNTTQTDANTALAIRTFLSWAIDPNGGSQSQFLQKEDFVGLPSSVIPKVQAAIAAIKG